MKHYFTFIRLMFISVVVSACGVSIGNFDEYQKTPLLQLEDMPTKEQLQVVLPRVVVVSEDSESELAQRSNVDDVIRSNLITVLEDGKFAEIIERERSEAIAKEVAIAEMEGKMVNVESVDYVFKVIINNVTFASSPFFMPATKYSPPQNGYSYSSIIDGVLKIYAIPTMKLLKTIPIKGSASKTEDAQSASMNVGHFGINIPQSGKDYDSNLIYVAVQKATRRAIPEIKNFLKKKAYIMEKRVLKNDFIYAINRGFENGIASQDELLVSRKTSEINPLTQEEEASSEKICTGIVAKNTIHEARAWVVFDKQCHERLRLGDEAQVQYK